MLVKLSPQPLGDDFQLVARRDQSGMLLRLLLQTFAHVRRVAAAPGQVVGVGLGGLKFGLQDVHALSHRQGRA